MLCQDSNPFLGRSGASVAFVRPGTDAQRDHSGSGRTGDSGQVQRRLSGYRTARESAMYVGTQIEPRDDYDYRVWAQLGVTHVCVDPPGSPHYWSPDALRRHKDHVEAFGLSLDMVQLPISSGPIEAG